MEQVKYKRIYNYCNVVVYGFSWYYVFSEKCSIHTREINTVLFKSAIDGKCIDLKAEGYSYSAWSYKYTRNAGNLKNVCSNDPALMGNDLVQACFKFYHFLHPIDPTYIGSDIGKAAFLWKMETKAAGLPTCSRSSGYAGPICVTDPKLLGYDVNQTAIRKRVRLITIFLKKILVQMVEDEQKVDCSSNCIAPMKSKPFCGCDELVLLAALSDTRNLTPFAVEPLHKRINRSSPS
ncbi:hypothetical protein RND71_021411 [Anisodus tanguticus]|uniref:Uncharacterized protein n=1 Tax=Anisodus tanguticus TaxID=243964 RepID=A0AAE1V882_9SOLA|nr:hypothetical protein RND71_021411 [Anisodus tanguticus]